MKFLVIIPTYNERHNIEDLIKKILVIDNSLEVLVVDDSSPDLTSELILRLSTTQPRIHLIKRNKRFGFASAYLEGFHYALRNNFDYVFQMDGDGSHSPEDLKVFLDLIKKNRDWDVLVGSRYIRGAKIYNWQLSRYILSRLANIYSRLVTGLNLKDCTSGFKCFKRQVLEKINFKFVDSYAFQVKMNLFCKKGKFNIVEIPINFQGRCRDASKLKIMNIFKTALEILQYREKLGIKYV